MARRPTGRRPDMSEHREAREYRRTEPEPRRGEGAGTQVQTKLHRWATADASRRFDDLFNLVTDPAFLGSRFHGEQQPSRPDPTARTCGESDARERARPVRRGTSSKRISRKMTPRLGPTPHLRQGRRPLDVLYRAIDQYGQVIDVSGSPRRDARAARNSTHAP